MKNLTDIILVSDLFNRDILFFSFFFLFFASKHGLHRRPREAVKAHSGKFCSGFDVLTAELWQCRTRALNLQPSTAAPRSSSASSPVEKVLVSSIIMEAIDMIQEASSSGSPGRRLTRTRST